MEEQRHLLQMRIRAYNKKGCTAFHSKRESISDGSLTSFPEENAAMPYSGFEPELSCYKAYPQYSMGGISLIKS
ncbi:hypothetical protein TNCV_210851 [Trichonephila clavipes]|uniref:Uncharacterized protein n=1 Tax=Trichonephila clavipes TaxID=2585209 RepID=A0A8X6VS19_TRICX|nr:hypothetical protein TNCV_210851 [Trichonephila clavipes]